MAHEPRFTTNDENGLCCQRATPWPYGTAERSRYFRGRAETVVLGLRKGSQVAVDGSLRTHTYKKLHRTRNGKGSVRVTHYMTEIVAREVRLWGVPLVNGKDEQPVNGKEQEATA